MTRGTSSAKPMPKSAYRVRWVTRPMTMFSGDTTGWSCRLKIVEMSSSGATAGRSWLVANAMLASRKTRPATTPPTAPRVIRASRPSSSALVCMGRLLLGLAEPWVRPANARDDSPAQTVVRLNPLTVSADHNRSDAGLVGRAMTTNRRPDGECARDRDHRGAPERGLGDRGRSRPDRGLGAGDRDFRGRW